ncbi:tRNA uridine 5-oxyacetic acid(34) methyltransferase CmoM [Aeromonas cavernicola]|uniref:tRNA 5-carboxymethoxyuridine methyltransferase n=1 Tax=Aeromonas cavernicola TaxID=1006623 RepID=A0A2H9U9R7_9GAMM|nr:tRNA uridine 5-oxyacetic acid(34) methyltransferase CmoM [Aeromonas cavernicola]PJG60762.1 tRNA uridine 5-oxyacetic acid(34) methyltransferase CmoM [Aeromonas cavernicola]
MQHDQSFDGRADKFARNIYDSSKGRIRTTVVWRDIEACLARLGDRPLRILDAGGGFGYFAQKLAALGHQVELCDLSAEMLDLAREQIAEQGLADKIRLIHCPIQALDQHVTGTFDLVLCHAVLEWLAEPHQTLAGLFPFLKVGGILSLLFYNRHGLLFQSLVVGNFDYVRLGLRKKRQTALTPTNPQLPEQVYGWLEQGGLSLIGKTGVRVIHDYMRHKQDQVGKFDDLLAMELQYCQQEPFVSLGRYIHVMAQKPAA